MTKSEIKEKIKSIKRKLDELRQYKVVMAEEGAKPDREDKIRESELIVRLLRLEKELDAMEGRAPKKKKPLPTPRDPLKRPGRRDRSKANKSTGKRRAKKS